MKERKLINMAELNNKAPFRVNKNCNDNIVTTKYAIE